MNRQKPMFYGLTAKHRRCTAADLVYLLPLIVIHYCEMYTITVVLQYKRGAEMNKEEVIAKVEKMSVEEKFKLLPVTDQAYIRGFIDRSVVEQMKSGPKKSPLPKQKRKKENQNENR